MAARKNSGLWRAAGKTRRSADEQADAPAAHVWPSELFDPWYYGLQLDQELSAEAAAQHYLDEGAFLGLLPNPLTDVLATGLTPEVVVAAFLDGTASSFPVRPIMDDLELVRLSPRSAKGRGGPVAAYLAHARQDAPVPPLGGRTWRQFVRLRTRQAELLPILSDGGLFDREYYEAQAGRTFASPKAAMWHFLEDGASAGLSPSPLWEARWFRNRGDLGNAFAALVQVGQTTRSAGPHFDTATYAEQNPGAADHVGGPLGHFLEHADDMTQTVPLPGSGVEPVAYGTLRTTLLDRARQFGEHRRLLEPPPTLQARWWLARAVPPESARTDGVAILADVRHWGSAVPSTFRSLLEQRHTSWVVRIAVDAGKTALAELVDLAEQDRRIVLVPTEATSWPGRVADLLASTHEPWVAFWRPSENWSPYFLSGLLAGADDRGAHATIVEEPTEPTEPERWIGQLPAGGATWWRDARSFSGMLMSTERLRGEGVVLSSSDVQGPWDILLEHDLVGAYVPFVAVRGVGLTSTDSSHEHMVRAGRLLDWDVIAAKVGGRVADRTSILIVTHLDWRRTRDAISAVLLDEEGDLEVVVVDNGSGWDVSANLTALFVDDPRVRLVRLPRDTGFATAANVAFAESTGATVVFLDHDAVVSPGWRAPLVDALAGPAVLGAQALVLRREGTIKSAGAVFGGQNVLPTTFLEDHPVEDLPRQADLRFRAVTASCLALQADVVASARGFDEQFIDGLEDVDLCLRIAVDRAGDFVVVPDSRVVSMRSEDATGIESDEPNELRFLRRWGAELPGPETSAWEQAGFRVATYVLDPPLPVSRRRASARPLLTRPSEVVAAGPAAGLPRLRWAIKNAAPGGRYGDLWGDTFFAEDLAQALRSWGQDAFVDRRQAHARPGVDHLDDVTLTLRGRVPAVAQPGATNVMWVISHPDDVDVSEVSQGFDLVYSAGQAWAQQMSQASGRPIRTLLQATNTTRFTPDGDGLDTPGALFVGHTRGVLRPIVRDAIEIGADLRIFGTGWDAYVAEEHIAAELLPNSELPAAYRGARIVLNDHWSDMARLGFLSNRLFDAAAAGARVVSDPVDGLEEIFGPSVRTYRSLDELRALLDPASDVWADPAEIAASAAAIAAAHSFSARAQVLLADVLDVRGVEHDLHNR